MAKFLDELKRRKVVRAALSYLVVAWLIVQVISVIGPALGLTERFMQITLVVLAVGFPIAMLLSWFFNFSFQGVTRESDDEHSSAVPTNSGRSIDFVIIGVLASALVAALVYIGSTDKPTTDYVDTSVLAILPLENLSNTPDGGFVEGLHSDLLDTLSRLSPLQVISRTSVLGFRGSESTIREIGNRLGADKIIEGSIQLANDFIRVKVTLVDVPSDARLWSKTFDKPFNAHQLFGLQRDIALAVAQELKVALALDEDQRLKQTPTQSTEAYRLYLLGKLRLADRTSASLDSAVTYFNDALALDPQYAEAYAGLAFAYNLQHHYSNRTLDDMTDQAMPLVQRALALDPSLSNAYVVLADIRSLQNDIQGAESAYERALTLNENNALARHWFGIMLINQGRFDEALVQHKRAQTLDPLSPIISVNVAQDYSFLGNVEAALEEYQHTLQIKPDFVPAYAHMAALYGRSLKRPDEAVRWLRKAWELDPGHTEYSSQLAETLLDLGDHENAGRWADIAWELGPTQYWPTRAKLLHALHTEDLDEIAQYTEAMNAITRNQFHTIIQSAYEHVERGEFDQARALFLPNFADLFESPPKVNTGNYALAVPLAAVLAEQGQTAQAEALLTAALAIMADLPRVGFHGVELLDVAALSLLGREQAAVEQLAVAQSSNWSHGWWAIRTQPLLFSGIAHRREVAEFEAAMTQHMDALYESLSSEQTPPSE
ncbi:MAG: tetratricopeptide repeat protein [Pseudomonadota bacterium]